MSLKIPPVAVFLMAVALLAAGHFLLPAFTFTFPGQIGLALVLGLSGLVPGLQAVLEFIARKTTVNPMRRIRRPRWSPAASTASAATRCISGCCVFSLPLRSTGAR